MTFAELRSKVRAVLQDSNGGYWSDDELDLYLNEAQEEFCRHTRVLRGEHPITTRENQAVYTLPEDCLEVLRVVGKNGAEVEPSHSRSLHGYRLDTTGTGDPTYHYSDLDGDGKMRFYPQPSPTIETGPTTFADTVGYLVDQNLGLGTVKSLKVIDDKLYVADETNLYEYEIDGTTLTLLDSIAHTISVSDNVYLLPVPSGQDPTNNPSLTYGDMSDVWVIHSQSIYRWDRSLNGGLGAMVLFVNAGLTSPCNGVIEFPRGDATALGWVGNDGVLYSTALNGFSEVASAYTGLGAITYSQSSSAYSDVLIGGVQYRLTHTTWSGPISPVSITDSRSAAATNFVEIPSTVTDEQWSIDSFGTLYVVYNDAVHVAEADNADYGAIVYFNGSTFSQETGAVVDLTSDDLVTFDSEVGIVTSFITAEKVATAYYVRKPKEGLVEISDPLALVWYAISRAYEQDGEQSHLARAQYYSRKFRDGMGRTKRRVASGYNGNTSPRKGRYY